MSARPRPFPPPENDCWPCRGHGTIDAPTGSRDRWSCPACGGTGRTRATEAARLARQANEVARQAIDCERAGLDQHVPPLRATARDLRAQSKALSR